MENKRKEIMRMLKKLFMLKGREPTIFMLDCWYEVLQKFDLNAIARAFSKAMQKDGFFEIKMVLDELVPNNKVIAEDEWENCMQVARDGGRGFDGLSYSTQRALRIAGGLQKLRLTESEYTRNHMRDIFINTYDVDRKEIGYDKSSDVFQFIDEVAKSKQLEE